MPHDGHGPSWLEQRPNIKRMAWIAFAIVCAGISLFLLRLLLGQDWLLEMLSPGELKDFIRYVTGAPAPNNANNGA